MIDVTRAYGNRSTIAEAIARARADLDRALRNLESLAEDDRKRVGYSVHALNNYLMVVTTTVEMLRARLAPGGDREVRRMLDSLRQATHLMMSTTRGVLTSASDGVPPLLFELASLAEIAENVSVAYREIARNKGIRIAWRRPVTPDVVVTDRVAASAVLDNLLSNAVKYSNPGSVISVTARVVGSEVCCSVRDRGPGITDTDREQVFRRGVTLSSRPTAGESANGYGLAIAHDLAEALGGRLTFTSSVGKGSCFTFSLRVDSTDVFLGNVDAAMAISDQRLIVR